jgi:Flp pilus assembly protein TadD
MMKVPAKVPSEVQFQAMCFSRYVRGPACFQMPGAAPDPEAVRTAASHFFEWDHAKAETEFRRAMELAPHEAVVFSWYADYLLDLRRFDEARVYYRRAHELAPRWLEPMAFVGHTHLVAGNPDLAIVEYERFETVSP